MTKKNGKAISTRPLFISRSTRLPERILPAFGMLLAWPQPDCVLAFRLAAGWLLRDRFLTAATQASAAPSSAEGSGSVP